MGLDHEKWWTLVRMENVGGPWALGNPFRYSEKANGAAPWRPFHREPEEAATCLRHLMGHLRVFP